ncbi:MAG: 50S ribosomal protein L10 [Planctomycetota bacterium]|nr:MAG: 50S ribosomal protein L10 [Planctomycetota bacterium]
MRKIKSLIIEEFIHRFENVKSGVCINYQGISSEELNQLRNHLKNKNVKMLVYKNTLARIGLKKLNLGVEGEEALEKEIFSSPTAFLYNEDPDPIAAAKAFEEWKKENKDKPPAVKGGFHHQKLLSKEEVDQYAKIPDKPTLLSLLVGAVQGPLTSTVGAIDGLLRELVGVVEAIHQKQKENPASTPS